MRCFSLAVLVLTLSAPALAAPADTTGWKEYEGTYLTVTIPPDWSFITVGDDGFKPPVTTHSSAEVVFVRKQEKDPTYVNFDKWLREHAVKGGKAIKVGRFRAVMAPVETGDKKVVARTYIAVPYAKKKGGMVRLFQLDVDKDDADLARWTSIYEAMVKTLKLFETSAPAP
jgi:hypothetical protein